MRMATRKPRNEKLPSPLQFSLAASLFSALANEARLRVLVALSRVGPLPVGELVPIAGIEQTALSHQLRILRSANLVTASRRGKQIVYALADDHINCILDDGLDHAAEQRRSSKERA